ncbi:alpha/beta fold hydrolase [Streptomyces sp. YKOK-I1]
MTIWTDLWGSRVDTVTGAYTTRVLQMGTGPGLLLLHGQGGSLENFRHNIPAYAREHHVVAIDLLWHGGSGTPPVDRELLPTFLAQVEEIVERMGWDHYSIEGQSLGGWVAALHALRHPERVDALVLTTPMGLSPTGEGLTEELRQRVLAGQLAALGDVSTAGIRARLEMLFHDTGAVDDEIIEVRRGIYERPEVNAALRQVARNYLGSDACDPFLLGPDELAALDVPTLVYWGSANVGGDEAGRALAAGIKGAQYHCAQVGHWAQYEQADEHNSVVLAFLRQQLLLARGATRTDPTGEGVDQR